MKAPEITIEAKPLVYSTEAAWVCFGSCFTEHFYDELVRIRLPSFHRIHSCNHFNPVSLRDMLQRLASGEALTKDDIYPAHLPDVSDRVFTTPYLRNLFALEPSVLLGQARYLDSELVRAVQQTSVVLLTLGTADALAMRDSGRVQCAANHISRDQYVFRSLTVEVIKSSLVEVREALLKLRGGEPFTMILTISPQRYFWNAWITSEHPRQDFVQNQLSKSKLRVAVADFVEAEPDTFYFPSYEIALDELRWIEPFYDDGRFTHANPETPRYIIKKFIDTCFSEEMHNYIAAIKRVQLAVDRFERFPQMGSEITNILDESWQKASEIQVDGRRPVALALAFADAYSRLGCYRKGIKAIESCGFSLLNDASTMDFRLPLSAARIFINSGEHGLARRALEALISQGRRVPHNYLAEAFFISGELETNLGERRCALEKFEQCLAIDPLHHGATVGISRLKAGA